MRVANVQTDAGQRLAVARDDGWALLEGPGVPTSVDDLVHGGEEARQRAEKQAETSRPLTDAMSVGLCVPQPGKIICIGFNYGRHAVEAGLTLTTTPLIFAKFNNTLVPAGLPVALPTTAEQYDYEAELGVVIGRRAVKVSTADALDYVWGYCNCNDLTARDLASRTSQFTLGKTLDGFLPVGPELVSSDAVGDPQNLTIQLWLNGELRQDANTSDMVFSVSEVISYISQYLPLEPGDFIATGTPSGVILGRVPSVWMKPGDVVDVQIEGLGRLTTPLVRADW
jgi:2-keto-4-pentenoate hydratase/2-oxohepta-3-ene-1,7-dioic acid hydratase in catechol pathway